MPFTRRALAETLEARRLYADAFPFGFGGGGFDNAQKAVQAPGGDIVIAGLFSGTTNFARSGRAKVLTARGDTDVFVARYTAGGTLKWALRVGGDTTERELSRFTRRDVQIRQNRFSQFIGRIGAQPAQAGEYVNDIALDSAGNLYLAGAFRGDIRVGRSTLSANADFTGDFYDAMVLKLSSNGTLTWARQFGGAFDDDALTVAVDGQDRPTIGGYYSREIDVDPTSSVRTLRTDGRDAGFVLRLTDGGDLAWSYQFDSDATSTDERNSVNDIAVTRRGDVYLAGTFASTADFEPGSRRYELESEGKTDAVLARLNRKGALVWAERTGGEDYDGNSAVALDAAGDVYTAGYFSDEADVDPRPAVRRVLTAATESDNRRSQFSDLLVSRVAADGTPVWQAQLGGPFIEVIADIAVSPDGGVLTSGSFFNSIDLDPGRGRFTLSSVLSNAGSIKDRNTDFGRNETYDWFAVHLSRRGKFVNGARFGGADDDYASGLTVLSGGNLLLSGRVTRATGTRRDERQEQSLIELLGADLSIL